MRHAVQTQTALPALAAVSSLFVNAGSVRILLLCSHMRMRRPPLCRVDTGVHNGHLVVPAFMQNCSMQEGTYAESGTPAARGDAWLMYR